MTARELAEARANRMNDLYRSETQSNRFQGEKCWNEALKVKDVAMKYFRGGHYLNAVEWLNKALCLAPTEGIHWSLLFFKRAEAYFAMEMFAECMDSIRLARDKFPDRFMCKLIQLETVCAQKIRDRPPQDVHFELRLSHPANCKNPSVINAMRLATNEQFGRHLVADKDLQVGDVICIEKPYVSTLQPDQRYTRCTHCLNEVPHRLVPCRTCTNAMYCCLSCEKNSWTVYHKHECNLTDELYDLALDVARLALRTFFVAMPMFDHQLCNLQEFLETNCDRKVTPFEVDYRENYRLDQFLAYYNGFSDDCHMPHKMKEHMELICARLVSLLSEYSRYSQQLVCWDTKTFLMQLFYHFLCVNTNNCYEIGSPTMHEDQLPTALGLYLCMSMAAHSCSGNVMRMRYGTKQIWVVTHFIPKGNQIFDNYGSFFMSQSYAERQKRCRTHYGFDCKCEACVYKYPLAKDLPTPCGVPFPEIEYLGARDVPLTMAKVDKELRYLRRFIQKYDCNFPCQQLRLAEVRLGNLFRRIAGDENLSSKYPEFYNHDWLSVEHGEESVSAA